jgi:hypothetical protein
MFGSFFDTDIEKLRKGKLAPEKAIGQSVRLLDDKNYPMLLADEERKLLVAALLMLSPETFAQVIIVKPQIVGYVIYLGGSHILDRLHFSYLVVSQACVNKSTSQLQTCMKTLYESLTSAALLQGEPQEEGVEWHQYWWEEIRAAFFEAHLTIDFCPKCGMDCSLANLELSKMDPHYPHWFKQDDPRFWSIVCNECGAVLQRFASNNGGRTNVREIAK